MRLELSEVLACPRCGPPQVMVAVVHDSVGPRVRSGFLGCPACESRFPIIEGVLHLLGEEAAGSGGRTVTTPAAGASPVTPPSEVAVLVAAVLGLEGGRGGVLLGPGLASIGPELAAVAGNREILSLVREVGAGESPPENLSRVVIAGAGAPPVLPRRFEAVAVAGGDSTEPVEAFAEALAPLGRLAIVGPLPRSEDAARAAGLRVIASDARVVVARREG